MRNRSTLAAAAFALVPLVAACQSPPPSVVTHTNDSRLVVWRLEGREATSVTVYDCVGTEVRRTDVRIRPPVPGSP